MSPTSKTTRFERSMSRRVYNAATAKTACGQYQVCSPSGTCINENKQPYAEQIIWEAEHAQEPMHAIATYAMTDFELAADLDASLWVGLRVHLFGLNKTFTLFNWKDSFDLGSIQRSKLQPGLEATYQWDDKPLTGLVTNYQPGEIQRYPDPTQLPGYDHTDDLLQWCKPELAASVENPVAPTQSRLKQGVASTVDFGGKVGQSVYDTKSLCIGGRKMFDFLQDKNAMSKAFGHSATCSYVYLYAVWDKGFLFQLGDGLGHWRNYISPDMPDAVDGNYHLITLSVIRHQADGGRLYVDDQLRWTFNPTGVQASVDNDASLTMGLGQDVGSLNGDLDELMLFGRALDATEVQALFAARANGVCR